MDYINFIIPATPAIEKLVAVLLQQDGIVVSRTESAKIEKPRDLLTLAEGAKVIGVSYFTFRKWVIEQNRIPHIRPSGARQGGIRVMRSEIYRFLEKKKKKPGPKGREVTII